MITLFERLPALREPIIGCRLETLYKSYSEIKGMCSFFRSDSGGILCLFGSTLYLSGSCGGEDLKSLANFCRASQIISLEGDAHMLDGWTPSSHSIMLYEGGKDSTSPEIDLAPSLNEVYKTICEIDSEFKEKNDYIIWLSDITHRINMDAAVAAACCESSVALISHIGCGHAHISHVVTLPGHRGKGYAKGLVKSLASLMYSRGLRAFVETQDDSLNSFYAQIGFTQNGRLTILTPSEEHS